MSPSLLFSIFLLFLFLAKTSRAISDEELDRSIAALRSNGYNLFSNGIITSDLHYQMLSAEQPLTLFSPVDSALYSLDLASEASTYVQKLRYHVSPSKHTISDLRGLRNGSYLTSLLSHRHLLISNDKGTTAAATGTDCSVCVNGVRVSMPDLYIGENITVHGLEGILALRAKEVWVNSGISSPSISGGAPVGSYPGPVETPRVAMKHKKRRHRQYLKRPKRSEKRHKGGAYNRWRSGNDDGIISHDDLI